ncbi:MAG: MotA/TolQ/ExbB proton channel family protein [Phycisphaerae bacterium]
MSLIDHIAMLGQAPGGAGAGLPDAVQVGSVWDFVIKGGPMMIPIGVCSLIALTVFVERLVTLRRRCVIPPGFLPGLLHRLRQGEPDHSSDRAHDGAADADSDGRFGGGGGGKRLNDGDVDVDGRGGGGGDGDDKADRDRDGGRDAALAYCSADGSPVSNVFAAGIRHLRAPVDVLERRIREAGERVVRALRRYMRVLAVIASIAPLMGLLGTIFGMIRAFQTVATSAEALGKTELLAKGIYEAMITTAAGLLVAIPVLIAYHVLSARIEGLVADMDAMAADFVERYAAPVDVRGSRLQRASRRPPTPELVEDAAAVGPG